MPDAVANPPDAATTIEATPVKQNPNGKAKVKFTFTRENARLFSAKGRAAKAAAKAAREALAKSAANQSDSTLTLSTQRSIAEAGLSSLDRQSESVRANLATVIERNSIALASAPVGKTVDTIQRTTTALEPLVRSAERVFQWDKQEVGGVVSFTLLSSPGAAEQPARVSSVVDVQEVSQPAPEVKPLSPEAESALAALILDD